MAMFSDGQDGYWFGIIIGTWWWSKKQAFPWIYRDDSAQWDYLMVLPDGINVFDLENRRWRRRGENTKCIFLPFSPLVFLLAGLFMSSSVLAQEDTNFVDLELSLPMLQVPLR